MKIFKSLITSIIILLFNSLNTFAASLENSPYKIYTYWMMGCDNWGNCRALGFPNKIENNSEQDLYVIIDWKQNNDNLTIQIGPTSSLEIEGSTEQRDMDLILCENDNLCNNFVINNRIILISKELNKYKYFKIKNNNTNHISKIFLNDFLGNYKNLHLNNLNLYINDNLFNIKKINNLTKEEISMLRLDNNDEETCDNDINFYLNVTYENDDTFLFICGNDGRSITVLKKIDNIYKNFQVVNRKTGKYLENGFVNENLINFYDSIDNNIPSTLNLNNSYPSSVWSCGTSIKLSYNGQKFFIYDANIMPICLPVFIKDWITIYRNKDIN